jgi:hypothetical protein
LAECLPTDREEGDKKTNTRHEDGAVRLALGRVSGGL